MQHNPHLTSSEVSSLWASFMADTMNICTMTHFLETVEDAPTKHILQHSLDLSKGHIQTLVPIFKEEHFPIPQGYLHTDVVEGAPRLFSDTYYVRFLQFMAKTGISINGLALGTAYRKDIRAFFSSTVKESEQLYNMTIDLLEKNGSIVRSPYVDYPDKVSFIQEQEDFLAGILTRHKRPLTTIEVSHLSNNTEANVIGRTFVLGLSQVSETPEVKKHFQAGIDLSNEIIKTLVDKLGSNFTDSPFSADSTLSSSTTPPFSEKLMLGITASMNALSLENLAKGLSASLRSDLVAEYTKLMAKVIKYTSQGAKIGIQKGWIEKPPQTLDRKELQKGKK